jgi:hypothetical protein
MAVTRSRRHRKHSAAVARTSSSVVTIGLILIHQLPHPSSSASTTITILLLHYYRPPRIASHRIMHLLAFYPAAAPRPTASLTMAIACRRRVAFHRLCISPSLSL